MAHGIRRLIIPERQRRTLDDLTTELDLREGDLRSRQTAFWTMLFLSAIIASAGVLADSTATVIGAMIIAPLSTPIMGIAIAIAKRERNGSTFFVLGGVALVVLVGVCFSFILPGSYDLLDNGQISGRVSPGALDMVAALATGLAGAVALARKDVAAVLPGVAIAISLVPPLAVVGVCLGRAEWNLAYGSSLLFLSNLLALVLAGTLVFTFLGYAEEAVEVRGGSRRRAYVVLSVMLTIVAVPLLGNTLLTFLLSNYAAEVESAAQRWVSEVPGASVTGVENHGLSMTVMVRTPTDLPPSSGLLPELRSGFPSVIGIDVQSTQGQHLEVRPAGGGSDGS